MIPSLILTTDILTPDLNQKYPLKTLELFLIILNISIIFFLKENDRDVIEDHSLSWRKYISKKSIGKNFRNVLVDIVKDVILYIGNNVKERFTEMIMKLNSILQIIQFLYIILKLMEEQ